MNPRNSKKVNASPTPPTKPFELVQLQGQLEKLQAALQAVRQPQPNASAAPRLTIRRSDAHIVAQWLETDASFVRAIDLQEQDENGIKAFLFAANEVLKDRRLGKSVSFEIEPHGEKTDFGLLCAFVSQRLAGMKKAKPDIYRATVDI